MDKNDSQPSQNKSSSSHNAAKNGCGTSSSCKNSDNEKNQDSNHQFLAKLKREFYTNMAVHREKIIVYALMIIGLLLVLFTSNLLGGLMIGMVAGYYFASEIIGFIRNIAQIVRGQDQLRYVILATVSLALFIEAPGIFIGAIIVATFKQVMTGPQ